jgi:hypothetical protein
MFVDISEPKDVIEVDIWYKETRKANGNKISPEIAMEALSYTNNFANIKTILNDIEKLETLEEKMQFKEVIFSMIEGRASSDDSIKKMKNIAKECGFLEEFEKHKVYCNGLAKSSVPIYHERYPKILKVATEKELVDATNKWRDKEIEDVLICEETDFIHDCADTEIHWDKLPSVCIFPNAEKVMLKEVKGIKQLRLKEGCALILENMVVPNKVEFDKCKECKFNKCSFVSVDSASFREGADVLFYKCKSTPFRMDLSMCKSASFGGSDFYDTKSIKLKNERMREKFKNETMYSLECNITTLEEELMMRELQNSL